MPKSLSLRFTWLLAVGVFELLLKCRCDEVVDGLTPMFFGGATKLLLFAFSIYLGIATFEAEPGLDCLLICIAGDMVTLVDVRLLQRPSILCKRSL